MQSGLKDGQWFSFAKICRGNPMWLPVRRAGTYQPSNLGLIRPAAEACSYIDAALKSN